MTRILPKSAENDTPRFKALKCLVLITKKGISKMPEKILQFNPETGEVKERIMYSEKEIRDEYQKEQERRKRCKEHYDKVAEKIAYHQYINNLKGDFVMLLYNVNEALDYGISQANLTRLIYLSTYTSYNNNRLELPNGDIITKSSMEDIMGLPRRTFEEFYNELISKNILLKQENSYYLNTDFFVKGKLNKQQLNQNRIQLYIKGIRTLYRKSSSREHKQLAYLFQAIPYVNINSNTICHNPLEQNFKAIKPMTVEQYCMKVGYNVLNARRFKSNILHFRLKEKPVFNFVKNCDGEFIFINPYVYYGGNAWDKVAVLGGFTTQEELEEEYEKRKE